MLGRILDGSRFEEFKSNYGKTLVTGEGSIGGRVEAAYWIGLQNVETGWLSQRCCNWVTGWKGCKTGAGGGGAA